MATRRTGSEWVFDQLHVGEGDHLQESVRITDQENVLIWGRTYYQEAFDLWGEHGSMTEELSKPTIGFNLNKIHRSLSQARKVPKCGQLRQNQQPPPNEHSTSPYSSRVWGFVKHAQTKKVNHRRLMSSWS